MNAYVSGAQKVIPAVLLYAFYEDKVLMIHAHGKDGMPAKWNGLGGKLDLGESALAAAVREFEEEAVCNTRREQWQWLGHLHFPNFKAQKKEDWWVTVFVTDLTKEQLATIPLSDSSLKEGILELIPVSKVMDLDLWDGDRHFLPSVFARKAFQGTFFYQNGHCIHHEITSI